MEAEAEAGWDVVAVVMVAEEAKAEKVMEAWVGTGLVDAAVVAAGAEVVMAEIRRGVTSASHRHTNSTVHMSLPSSTS